MPGPEPALRAPKLSGAYRSVRTPLRVCEPVLAGNELRYVSECVRSGWISSIGPAVRRFEKAFARRLGVPDAVACSSGTAALHLALSVLNIGPGDEVILPTFTMVAVCNAVLYLGARPVLVDSDPVTWNMDPDQVRRRINRRTKAIIAVHTYGHAARMDELSRLARKHGLFLVEDAAEALGGSFGGRKLGTWGTTAAFSFYANKVITTGEGGMVAAASRSLGDKLRVLRDHAFSKDRHFWHRVMGYNYRMTALQAAIGLAQLERFSQLFNARLRNARLYRRGLAGVPGLTLPHDGPGFRHAHWVFGMLVEPAFGLSRDGLRGALARRGIETRTFFVPLHLQPVHRQRFAGLRFPVAEDLCRKGLYLPSSSGLSPRDIGYVAAMVQRAAPKETRGAPAL